MTTERENGDQTPINLASEIHSIFNPRTKTSGEIAEEKRKAEEERESKRRLYRERNEPLRKEVRELGLREIFLEARHALAQHYPNATVHEQWDGKDAEMSDDRLYLKYRIILAWGKPATYDPITRADLNVSGYYYTDAVYTRTDESQGAIKYIRRELEIGLRNGSTKIWDGSELKNINPEKLKRELLEGIAHPNKHAA